MQSFEFKAFSGAGSLFILLVKVGQFGGLCINLECGRPDCSFFPATDFLCDLGEAL